MSKVSTGLLVETKWTGNIVSQKTQGSHTYTENTHKQSMDIKSMRTSYMTRMHEALLEAVLGTRPLLIGPFPLPRAHTLQLYTRKNR